ncbi:YczE/YyaS/YitT family protein [Cetobacterium somerae]|uniref:YczE/YyaS/YitT family protein n=1 Tax=Cetobacterium somerae TaxID=188913 RepID=UPI0038928B5B
MQKQKILKYTFYFLGIILLSFGITLTLISNLGAGGWDALIQNISTLAGISIGESLWGIAIMLLIISGIIIKKFPDIKVLIVSWITGITIDIFYYKILKNIYINAIYLKGIFLISGIFLIALGCSMMFVTNLPKNHTETFAFALVKRFGYSYKNVKIGLDISALFLAIIIGINLNNLSNIGVGTFVSSIFMGYLIDKLLPNIRKVYKIL